MEAEIKRTISEIERAHDLLVCLIKLKDLGAPMTTELYNNICDSASVLCWLLGHKLNDSFAENLKYVEEQLADHDLDVDQAGELLRAAPHCGRVQ
jgi:hypothetical protein